MPEVVGVPMMEVIPVTEEGTPNDVSESRPNALRLTRERLHKRYYVSYEDEFEKVLRDDISHWSHTVCLGCH